MAKNIKAWNNAQQPNEGSKGFKNKIINGDFSVNQRENSLINNEIDYPIDRVMVEATNSSIGSTTEVVYSLNEGSLVDSKDPFGDGSLLAKYQLNGDAKDLLGNYDGKLNGGYAFVSGKFGKGFTTTDEDGRVEISQLDDILDFNANGASVSFWMKLPDSYITRSVAFELTDKNDLDFIFYMENDQIGFGNANYLFRFDSKPYKGFFVHVVATYDSVGYKLFLNGKHKASYTCDQATRDRCSVIGSIEGAGGNENFIGVLDQVSIFNKVLTEDEVRKLYVEDSNYIQKKHYKCEVITKDTDPVINPYIYNFEGQDIVNIINKDLALSFDFMSNKTGTYNVSLVTQCLDGTTEEYAITFDYNKDDFERVNIVIPANTFTKPIVDDHNLGASIYIAKESNDNLDPGDTIRLANVQLEEGNVATDFELLPKDTQLQRCMRYFEKTTGIATYMSNDNVYGTIHWNTEKRTEPSLKFISPKTKTVGVMQYHDNKPTNKDIGCYRIAQGLVYDSRQNILFGNTNFTPPDTNDSEASVIIEADAEF